MMRRVLLLSVLFLPLVACSGAGLSCTEQGKADVLLVCIPEGWSQVSEEKLRAEGVPEETVAAFESADTSLGSRGNVVITRERVASSVTAAVYAGANARTIAKTPEYNEIEQRQVSVAGQDTILHIFSARPVVDLPVRRFYQVSLVIESTGFVVTGTLPFSVDEATEKTLVDMLLGVTEEKKAS